MGGHTGEHGEDATLHTNGVPVGGRTGNGSPAPADSSGAAMADGAAGAAGAAGAVAGSAVTTVNASRPPSTDGAGPGEPVRVQVEVVVRTVASEPDTRSSADDR